MSISPRLVPGILLVLAWAATAGAARAQWREPSAFASHAEARPAAHRPVSAAARPLRSTELLVLGGVVGGGVGFAAGALAGAAVEVGMGCDYDYCGLGGALFGAVIGETLLLPLGVHVANGRHGNYGYAVLASAGSVAVGLLLSAGAGAVGGETGIEMALWAVPVVQLASSISIERRTARAATTTAARGS